VPPNAPFAPHRDPWIRLGTLGALFTGSVIFVQLPIGLWAGNAAEFQSSSWRLLALGAAAVVVAVACSACLLRLLPPRTRRVTASALCAVGLIAWIQGNFIVGSMNVLNGQGAPVDFASGHPPWTMLAAVVACIVVAFGVSRAPRAAAAGLALLTVGLHVATIATITRSPAQGRSHRVASITSVFRFSSRENVLVVLLDGLESGVARHVFRQSPTIERAFDGFQLYPDTAGVARTTFLSLPAIHSGTLYSPPLAPAEYFVDAIRRQSFMNRFADAGFDTVLLNPIDGVCPARVRACAATSQVLRGASARLKHESLQLLDLSLFRASPAWLKRRIYNDGKWLTAGRMDVPYEIARVVEGNELLGQLAQRLSVDDGAPSLKFVHSVSTHTPYVLNEDCHTFAASSLEHLIPQARCGLLAVASLLNRLKDIGAYDNTLIVVMADHGIDPGVYGRDTSDGLGKNWRHLAGAANPVFLMKPQGRRGPLTQVRDAVHVPDLGAMLCARSRRCRKAAPMADVDTAPTRPRRFEDYDWTHEFWRTGTVANITSYEIRGPVWQRSSWSRHNAGAP
jgi:hypothetical protein